MTWWTQVEFEIRLRVWRQGAPWSAPLFSTTGPGRINSLVLILYGRDCGKDQQHHVRLELRLIKWSGNSGLWNGILVICIMHDQPSDGQLGQSRSGRKRTSFQPVTMHNGAGETMCFQSVALWCGMLDP